MTQQKSEPCMSQEKMLLAQVRAFRDQYGLDEAQTSKVLRIPRSTLESGLEGWPSTIEPVDLSDAQTIMSTLNRLIDQNHEQFGPFLRRKMDTTVSAIMTVLEAPEFEVAHLRATLEGINFRLEGMVRSKMLSESLKGRKALI